MLFSVAALYISHAPAGGAPGTSERLSITLSQRRCGALVDTHLLLQRFGFVENLCPGSNQFETFLAQRGTGTVTFMRRDHERTDGVPLCRFAASWRCDPCLRRDLPWTAAVEKLSSLQL